MSDVSYVVRYYRLETEDGHYSWTFELDDESKAECADLACRPLPATISLALPVSRWADVSFVTRRGIARSLAGLYNYKDVVDLSLFEWRKVDPKPGMWQCEGCGKWIPQVGRPFCSPECVESYFAAIKTW